MIQVKESKNHYINATALSFGENDLENPNRVAVSLVGGAAILVHVKGTIDYAADGNFRRWTLKGYSTKLATNNTYYIYARLDRSAPEALIMFSVNRYALDGSIEGDSSTAPSTRYWYVRIGQLTETDGITNRELTYDSGLLGTDKDINESNSALEEMFELSKQSTPWLIRVKHWFESLTIRGALTLMGNLIFGDKTLRGVATSDNPDSFNVQDDEHLTTSKFVSDYVKENTEDKFLRKDKDDETSFLVKFLAGIEVGDTTGDKGAIIDALGRIVAESLKLRGDITVGREGFSSGMTGFGGYIDEHANAELESLVLRRFLEVPELRYNRVEIKVGDKWRAPGGGVIERVQPTLDADGNPTGEGYFWLKLEDGEIGAVAVDDICMGIFHDFKNPSNNETADSDDGLGNRTFSGFCTAYWRIEEVADYSDNTGTYHNKLVKYSIRPTSDRWSRTFEPMSMMNFVCYGNFTNPERQTSVYETRTYTRMLKNQNRWNFELANVALQYGDMSNFTALGRNVSNKYSLYVGDIYMTGTLTSVDINGDPILTVADKGEWVEGTVAAYYERYSYNGSLWLCVNENGTNQPPSENDPSWLLQVKAGQGVSSYPRWESSKVPYPASSILKFADVIWISNKETYEAPYPLYTDMEGSRFKFKDGGYVVAEKVQSADWDLLLDASSLVDGEDGDSIEVRYSADKINWHFPYREGDKYMQQRIGSESEWSDIIPFVGEDGAAGDDGRYTDYQFAKNSSLTDAPVTGWQETPPIVNEGEYLWMRMRVVDPNSESEAPWSAGVRLGGEKGEAGVSITTHGQWKSGMTVPAMGVVQMGGNSYIAKVETTNPPLWCYTDKSGNRYLFNDGGYILTGETNTEEYDLLVSSGKDGRDGKDYEWIYMLKNTPDIPNTPNSVQQDDYVPSGWNDNPTGVSETLPYEFASFRTKKDDVWSAFSTPALWAKFGKDGQNAVYADMSNEMDNVALSPEGKTTREWELTTTVAMWNGQTKAELKSIAISQANGVTSSYNLSTGVITFKIASGVSIADHNELSIVVTAHINGIDVVRTLTFTLAGVKAGADGKDAVLYDIVVSASQIVKMKDGSYSISNISAYRNKTIGSTTQKTTDGTLKYSIDGGAETTINNDATIQSSSISKKIQFIFYDANGVVVDKESVPIVEDGKDGMGIKSVTTSYAKSTSNTIPTSGWSSEMPAVGEGEYLWTRVVTDYTDDTDTVTYTYSYQGKTGAAGTSVSVEKIEYQAGESGTIPPSSDGWSEDVVEVPQGWFLWTRTTFSDGNFAYGVAKQPKDGEDGAGFEMMGNWHTGMMVPAMGVVQMGGGTYAAKVATQNPPLWCYTDKSGNRFKYKDGGYILTGEMNSAEYDKWVEKPADGKDGKDGATGPQGPQGPEGKPGAQGMPGMQGCILRYAEWQPGYEWRNDTDKTEDELKGITGGIRYLDCAFVRNDAASTGWDVYRATETHVSTENNGPETDGAPWEKFDVNVPAIFTNIILANQAHIDLLQGNDIMVKKGDGTVTAGMSGGIDGIRFWAGASQTDKANAPFRVNEQGESWLTNAHVSGEVNATSGVFKDVQIETGTIGGFTINEDTLYSNKQGKGRIIIQEGTNRGVFINESESSPLFTARNDNGTVMALYSQGNGATALETRCNSAGNGKALLSVGNSLLAGRYNDYNTAAHEFVQIAGLALSTRRGLDFHATSSDEIYSWIDFLVADGDITLPSAKNCKGKVLFVKAKGIISCQETNGGIVLADGTTIQVAKDRGNHAMIYISDGNSWYEFYCG